MSGPTSRTCTPRVTALGARLASALLVSGLLGAAAACGTTSAAPGTTVADGRLRVGLHEWTVATSAGAVAAGPLVVEVTNTGGTEHDLVVQTGAGVWRTPMLAPGEAAELEVEAPPGEDLRLRCTVPGHDAAGMRGTIEVVG